MDYYPIPPKRKKIKYFNTNIFVPTWAKYLVIHRDGWVLAFRNKPIYSNNNNWQNRNNTSIEPEAVGRFADFKPEDSKSSLKNVSDLVLEAG